MLKQIALTLMAGAIAGSFSFAYAQVGRDYQGNDFRGDPNRGAYSFAGRWMNFDRDNSGITAVVLTPGRDGMGMRVFGNCPRQRVCDWNVSSANLFNSRGNGDRNGDWSRDTDVITADFDTGAGHKFVILKREGRDDIVADI